MIYGYARCSTNEEQQDIDRQIRELKNAGAELIFTEYEHGDSIYKKEQTKLFESLRPGDVIITSEVSRLSRSTKQLCELIDIVKEKKIKLYIINSITIDCTNGQLDPMAAAFLQIAGVFAELELSMIRARVKSGMVNAKLKGKQIGRPITTSDAIPQIFYRHYPQYQSKVLNITEFSRVCGMSRTTIYKYIAIVNKL